MNNQTQPNSAPDPHNQPDRQDLWTMAFQIESMLGALMSDEDITESLGDPWAGTLWAAADTAKRLRRGIDRFPVNMPVETPAPSTPPEVKANPGQLPADYDPSFGLPENAFFIPPDAPKEIDTRFLEAQFERIYTMAWLLVISSPVERGDHGAWDDTTIYQALCQILTLTRQANMMFEHSRSGGAK